MCSTCGCNQPGEVITIRKAGEVIFGPIEGKPSLLQPLHDLNHHHQDVHRHSDMRLLELERDILGKNDQAAAGNRGYFEGMGITTLNLVSSPGSGKTTLLERTLTEMKGKVDFSVIEGDQQSMNDANRIAATGFPAVQVNTGKACHLDAEMVRAAVNKLDPPRHSILVIENVGNLVCPSMFDLGEKARVVIMSVTEGDDKPVKYPDMFHSSDLCIISKTDLLPYVPFNVEKAIESAARINHRLEFIRLSAMTGEGMNDWYDWLLKLSGPAAGALRESQAITFNGKERSSYA